MTPIMKWVLSGLVAFGFGIANRLSMDRVGAWLGWLFLVLIIAVFVWIIVQRGFASARYTPGVRRTLMAMAWYTVGFNLANFLKGLA